MEQFNLMFDYTHPMLWQSHQLLFLSSQPSPFHSHLTFENKINLFICRMFKAKFIQIHLLCVAAQAKKQNNAKLKQNTVIVIYKLSVKIITTEAATDTMYVQINLRFKYVVLYYCKSINIWQIQIKSIKELHVLFWNFKFSSFLNEFEIKRIAKQ